MSNRIKFDLTREFESKVNAYLHMAPQILVESLNYHWRSQETRRKFPNHFDKEYNTIVANKDEYEDFDCLALLEAIHRSDIDGSRIFAYIDGKRTLNGPFSLFYINGHRYSPSKFTLGQNKAFLIIGDKVKEVN